MSGDQIPSHPGKKRHQMPGVCPGVGEGGMLKLWFDWNINFKIDFAQFMNRIFTTKFEACS